MTWQFCEIVQSRDKLNEPRRQIKLSASSQNIPQDIEVPPNIEVKQIASAFCTVLFQQSNPLLLMDVFKLLIFPCCWQDLCKYYFCDPDH